MVNKLILQGRLVADPVLRYTQNGVAVASFRVAWSKRYQETETKLFLSCTAWRETGELISKHFSKGKEILLEGELVTRSWKDNEGNNRQSTELTVNRIHFVGTQTTGEGQTTEPNINLVDFAEIDDDSELPF